MTPVDTITTSHMPSTAPAIAGKAQLREVYRARFESPVKVDARAVLAAMMVAEEFP